MGRLSRVDWNETSWCWVGFFGDPGHWVEKVTCSAQHWCQSPGNESYDGLGSLVPCYGLSVRYSHSFGLWDLVPVVLCWPRGRRPEMYTVWRMWWPALGPGPDAQYMLWTLGQHLLSSHLPVCTGLVVWGMLDGATRGRCLIVLWGRGALCQRTGFGYTAVMVAMVYMPGCSLGGIWMWTLYHWLCVCSMSGHW